MVTWVGLQVGDYTIDHKLGEGNYSWVYHGLHDDTNESMAFKVAKPQDQATGDTAQTGSLPTKAMAMVTGGIADVKPLTNKLLALQHKKLAAIDESGLIRVGALTDKPELTYYGMEYLQGQTLRQLMVNERVTIEKMMEVSRCLDKLSKNGKFVHHGDIKPENIMFGQAGAVLIDPGYFGRLELENGSSLSNCAVTTPAYYPTLEPDDLLAFGLLLWEVVLGQQPLKRKGFTGNSDLSRIGPQLLELVQLQEAVGKYLLSAILDVQMPSQIHPNIDQNLERLLLQGLRLRSTQAGLELDTGFRSFAAFSGALAALRLRGKEHFLEP